MFSRIFLGMIPMTVCINYRFTRRYTLSLMGNSSQIHQIHVRSAGLARKKKACVWSPLASFYPRQVVNYRWSKKLHFSFILSCQLSSNKLVAKARNKTLFITQKFLKFLFWCVCVVSQFDLSITKRKYLFVRCQSLSHIPNTSLRC